MVSDFFLKNEENNEPFNHIKYQKYIDSFINKNKKPIIFIGSNDISMPFLINYVSKKKDIYNFHSQHNYYIKIDDKIVAEKQCKHFISNIKQTLENNSQKLMYDTDKFIKILSIQIKNECDVNKTIKQNNIWKKKYILNGYTYITLENIYKNILYILKNIK